MLSIANQAQKLYAKQTQIFSVSLVFLFSVSLALPVAAEAASLYLSPSSGTYTVGTTFNVNINVSSSDQALNAVQGVLIFSPSDLQIVAVSKTSSIISLWVQEPTFNNNTGRVNFEGVVLNPGFIGSTGRVLQVTFKAKSANPTTVSLSSASVLANDGQGTNILSQLGNGKYLLEEVTTAARLPAPDVKFIITSLDGDETRSSKPRLKFEIQNLKQIVDRYDIRIDNGDFVSWPDDGTHVYKLPQLDIGKHVITVRAYYGTDKFLINTKALVIKGLEKPEITEYPKQLSSGDTLIIRGKTQPNFNVNIFLQQDIDQPVSYTIKSDDTGDFAFLYDRRVSAGIYKFWAQAEDSQGAKSDLTEKLPIAVREAAIIRIGSAVVNAVTLIIVLSVLIALLAFIILYSWHKLRTLKKDLDREIVEGEQGLHKVFKALKQDVEEQIEKLDKAGSKRSLTGEEKEIRKTLLAHLDIAERYIEKELHDIEQKVLGDHSYLTDSDGGGDDSRTKAKEEIKKQEEVKKREEEVKLRAEKIQKHLKAAEKYIEKKVKDIEEESN